MVGREFLVYVGYSVILRAVARDNLISRKDLNLEVRTPLV